MLPAKIVGSVDERPFVLDVPTGKVTLDRHEESDPAQAQLPAETKSAVARQVRSQVKGALRLGEYRCAACGAWVDVVRHPERWRGERCARC